MKSKLLITGISIGITLIGIAAIATPVTIYLTSKSKYKNVDWINQVQAAEVVQNIVTTNQPDLGYLSLDSIKAELESQENQAKIIEQISASDAIASIYFQVIEVPAASQEVEKTYTITFSPIMKTGFFKDANPGNISGITADIILTPVMKNNHVKAIQGILEISEATTAAELTIALNAKKDQIANTIVGGDAIDIVRITATAVAGSDGYDIVIDYTGKAGYVAAGTLTINDFIVVPRITWKPNAADLMNETIPEIANVGINISNQSAHVQLASLLNNNTITPHVLNAIDNGDQINLDGRISVPSPTVADFFRIIVKYTPKEGAHFEAGEIVLTKFLVETNNLAWKSDAFTTLNAIHNVSTATSAATLEAALNVDQSKVLNAINVGSQIDVSEPIRVEVANPASNGYKITVPYLFKFGFKPSDASSPIDGEFIYPDFKIANTVQLDPDYVAKLNTIANLNTVADADSLTDALNAPAAEAAVLSAIVNSDKIILGDISVTGPSATGFNITVNYTSKPGYNVSGSPLMIPHFKINGTRPTLKDSAEVSQILNRINGVNTAVTSAALQLAFNNNKDDFLTTISFIDGQVNFDTISVIDDEPGFAIRVSYDAKDGFNIRTNVLEIFNFKPHLTLNFVEANKDQLLIVLNAQLTGVGGNTPALESWIESDEGQIALLSPEFDYINTLGLSTSVGISNAVVAAAAGFNQYDVTFSFIHPDFTFANLVLEGLTYLPSSI